MDGEENPEEVEEVEPKIILTKKNIEDGLSQLYRIPGKFHLIHQFFLLKDSFLFFYH